MTSLDTNYTVSRKTAPTSKRFSSKLQRSSLMACGREIIKIFQHRVYISRKFACYQVIVWQSVYRK